MLSCLNRRNFMRLGSAHGIVGGVMFSHVLRAADAVASLQSEQSAELHVGCQMSLVPGDSFSEKFDILEAHGFDRVELSGGNWEWLEQNVEAIQNALQGRRLQVSVACIGTRGNAGLRNAEERRALIETSKRVHTCVGHLKGVGAILCPARKKPELDFPELRARLLSEILPEIAVHAEQCHTCIVLEPLNRTETPFLRQVADGAALARDAKSPVVGVMGDFWHMTVEETSDRGAFISAGPFLRHVHIASRKTRRIPGLDGVADCYLDGFRGLKEIGYRGAISVEAGYPKGVTKREKTMLLAQSAALIRTQWNHAS